ncbi:MAG: hypothetical protein AABW51_02235 [Nanoarchaeota archaeon]
MDEEKEEGVSSRVKNVTNYGIDTGLNGILENHPGWISYRDSLRSHIDEQKFEAEKNRIFAETNEASRSGKFASEYLMWKHVYEQIAKVVASGKVFDDFGNEVILNKSLEERASNGFFVGGARRELSEQTELDKKIGAFNELYDLMKKGDYAQRMPELAEAAATIQDAGMLNAAVDILKYHGLIDGRKYSIIKDSIKEKADGVYETALTKIEEYSSKPVQKAAAAILGIFGVGILIATKTAITGGVIGTLPSSSSFIAIGLMIVSLIWMWKAFKSK